MSADDNRLIEIEPRQKVAILKILRDHGGPVSSADIARGIESFGLNLRPRTIRLYLQRMEELGLVAAAQRGRTGGRSITPRGTAEIADAIVLDRLGFTAAKVDRLAWEMDFDENTAAGQVVINVSVISQANLLHAVREMLVVFQAGLGMGEFVTLLEPGERIGNYLIPSGKIGIGTVCSVTINGILLNSRVHANSRFGAVLELRNGKPARFTDLIAYDGTTLDPLEIFIKARLTAVHAAAITGDGRIGASFREFPNSATDAVEKIRRRLGKIGLGGILMVGRTNQPLLDFPVNEGRTGMIVVGGLNPAAAVEEAGIETHNFALSCLCNFNRLIHYSNLQRRAVDMARR